MAIAQPTNISPSVFAGVGGGTVSAADKINIAWQVNGTSPLDGIYIELFDAYNEAVSGYTPAIVNTGFGLPFYGKDEKGNPQFFSYAPNNAWSAWGFSDGYDYRLKITQFWKDKVFVKTLTSTIAADQKRYFSIHDVAGDSDTYVAFTSPESIASTSVLMYDADNRTLAVYGNTTISGSNVTVNNGSSFLSLACEVSQIAPADAVVLPGGRVNSVSNGYRYVQQYSMTAFKTRTAPTLSIVYDDITTISGDFTANFAQAQGDTVNWVRWVMQNRSTGAVLDDTGKIYTADLRYTFDGFISGANYTVTCTVETSSGIIVAASSDFGVTYAVTNAEGIISTKCNADNSVTLSWNPPRDINGTPSTPDGYSISDAKITINEGESIVWDEVNGEPMAFVKPHGAYWKGTLPTPFTQTSDFKDENGNAIQPKSIKTVSGSPDGKMVFIGGENFAYFYTVDSDNVTLAFSSDTLSAGTTYKSNFNPATGEDTTYIFAAMGNYDDNAAYIMGIDADGINSESALKYRIEGDTTAHSFDGSAIKWTGHGLAGRLADFENVFNGNVVFSPNGNILILGIPESTQSNVPYVSVFGLTGAQAKCLLSDSIPDVFSRPCTNVIFSPSTDTVRSYFCVFGFETATPDTRLAEAFRIIEAGISADSNVYVCNNVFRANHLRPSESEFAKGASAASYSPDGKNLIIASSNASGTDLSNYLYQISNDTTYAAATIGEELKYALDNSGIFKSIICFSPDGDLLIHGESLTISGRAMTLKYTAGKYRLTADTVVDYEYYSPQNAIYLASGKIILDNLLCTFDSTSEATLLGINARKVLGKVTEIENIQNRESIYATAINPQKTLLVAGGNITGIRLYSLNGSKATYVKNLTLVNGDEIDFIVRTLNFNSDGSLLVAGGEDNHIYVFSATASDVNGGTNPPCNMDTVYTAEFSPASDILVIGGKAIGGNANAQVWTVSGANVSYYADIKEANGAAVWRINSCAFSPNGNALFLGSYGSDYYTNRNYLYIYSVNGSNVTYVSKNYGGFDSEMNTRFNDISISPDGKLLAVCGSRTPLNLASNSPFCNIFSVSGTNITFITELSENLFGYSTRGFVSNNSVAFSSDGSRLYYGGKKFAASLPNVFVFAIDGTNLTVESQFSTTASGADSSSSIGDVYSISLGDEDSVFMGGYQYLSAIPTVDGYELELRYIWYGIEVRYNGQLKNRGSIYYRIQTSDRSSRSVIKDVLAQFRAEGNYVCYFRAFSPTNARINVDDNWNLSSSGFISGEPISDLISDVTMQGYQVADYVKIAKENANETTDGSPIFDGNTYFLADFVNGNLQAGTFAENAQNYALYRKGRNGLSPYIGLPNDISEIKDYGIKSMTPAGYEIFYVADDRYSATVETQNDICMRFKSYSLIEAKPDSEYPDVFHAVNVWNFGANIENGTISNNNSPNMLQNFTPYRFRQPSPQLGKSGTLSALLGNTYTPKAMGEWDNRQIYKPLSKVTETFKTVGGSKKLSESGGSAALTNAVYAAEFSPNGNLLVVGGSFSGSAKLYSVNGNVATYLSDIPADENGTALSGTVYTVTFSKNGRFLAIGGNIGGYAKLYAVLGSSILYLQDFKASGGGALNNTVRSIAFCPDNKSVVLAGQFTNGVNIYSISGQTATYSDYLRPESGTFYAGNLPSSVAFSPDGKFLVTWGIRSTSSRPYYGWLYDFADGAATFKDNIYADGNGGAFSPKGSSNVLVHTTEFSADGKTMIASGDFDTSAKVYSVSDSGIEFVSDIYADNTGKLLNQTAHCAEMTKDGKTLILGVGSNCNMYNVNGSEITFVSSFATSNTMYGLALSPDNNLLFTGISGGSLASGTYYDFISVTNEYHAIKTNINIQPGITYQWEYYWSPAPLTAWCYQDTAEQMEKLFNISVSENVFFLKDLKGNMYMVHTSEPITQMVNNGTLPLETQISVPWEEIGNADNTIVIQLPTDDNYYN